jgi:hypothetical protein
MWAMLLIVLGSVSLVGATGVDVAGFWLTELCHGQRLWRHGLYDRGSQ